MSQVPVFDRAAPRALFFALLFLLLCLLRMPLADRPIRDVDESVSALIANTWLDGGVPYRDAIDQRGPVTYFLYAVIFLVAGRSNMLAVHWGLLFLILGGAFLAERFARRLDPGRAGAAWGWLAALLVVLASSTYRRSQLLAFHTEWPTLLLSTLGFYLTWRAVRPANDARDSAGRSRDLFFAGLAFGTSFLAKQPAIFDGAAAGGFVLLLALADGRLLRRETLLRALLLAGGFVTALGACVLYFALHGALADFYLYFWSYNVEHYTAVVPVEERFAALNPWHHRRHYLRANPLLMITAVVALSQLAASWMRAGRQRTRLDDARLLLLLWFAGAYFGASYSGRNFGHYFIQVIAPASLLAARVLLDAWQAAAALAGRWTVRLARAALGVAAGVLLTLSLHRYHGDFWIFERLRPAETNHALAGLLAVLRSETAPTDTLFVWGYNPEVYVLAERQPATRYSNTNYLTGMLPWENHQDGVDTSAHIVPGAWDILLQELATNPPAVIVDTVPGNHRYYRKYPIEDFPRLAHFLAAHYELLVRIPDDDDEPYYDVYVRSLRRKT